MTDIHPSGLLSPSDIADLAGVKRPVVSNWRKRHADFPARVAGNDVRPLFAKDAVLDWLRARGYDVKAQNAGAAMWSALNVTRGTLDLSVAADVLLWLATLKRLSPERFSQLADVPPPELGERFAAAVADLREVPGLRGITALPVVELPSASHALARFVDQTPDRDLADGVDFVLERVARWQIKTGADHGFVGSRTSTLLAALAQHATGVVYDPACGIGAVLVDLARSGAATRLVGSDVNRAALSVAARRAVLHGADIEFWLGDVLADDPFPALEADVVIAEPPFGMTWDAPPSALSDPRFTFGVAPRRSADLAWIQNVIAHLAPNGRGYALTAQGVLFRSGAERQIRSSLLSSGCVVAVVALPPRMLPQTAIGTALWVLRRPTEPSPVLVIDASETDDVEHKVANWLTSESANDGTIEAPHKLVTLAELLTADATLLPAKWIGIAAPDEDFAASFSAVSAALGREITGLDAVPLHWPALGSLPPARVMTVKELIDSGLLALKRGRPDKARDLDAATETRVVRASDVKKRLLPPTDGLDAYDDAEITLPGDVLVTTMNEVRAVVDTDGGHLPSTGVDRLRVTDQQVLAPAYLAAVLPGPWNARFQSGATIQRAAIGDLEVPMIALPVQLEIVDAHAVLVDVQARVARVEGSAAELSRTLLSAVRHGAGPGKAGDDQ